MNFSFEGRICSLHIKLEFCHLLHLVTISKAHRVPLNFNVSPGQQIFVDRTGDSFFISDQWETQKWCLNPYSCFETEVTLMSYLFWQYYRAPLLHISSEGYLPSVPPLFGSGPFKELRKLLSVTYFQLPSSNEVYLQKWCKVNSHTKRKLTYAKFLTP